MNSTLLPIVPASPGIDYPGRWWTSESDGRILCQLCPRACRLKDGDRGFCFVRRNVGGRMALDTYGRSTGFCFDPIEKKPLNHFLPGTAVLSFGTAGCNLGCKFCQNWDISKSREVARLSDRALPTDIAEAAQNSGCRSVAFTYNDPVIWAEYALDTAAACHELGIKTIAVTAGYITPEPRSEFYAAMDAANIDLKAFTEDFYYKLTGAHLDPVLDTIRYVCNETDCWVELTNLIIPDANDSDDELRRMCDWVTDAVGDEVPVHFTAFHPDFRMNDRPRTPHETLVRAFDIAQSAGLKYPYVGNVHDAARDSTYCPSCNELLIERDWHQLGRYALDGDRCRYCGKTIAGVFESSPGTWGRRRQPVRIDSPVRSPNMPTNATAPNSIQKSDLPAVHQAACRTVAAIVNDEAVDCGALLGKLADARIAGLFVTLKRGETLRGCCGTQGESLPLESALLNSATRTAKHDPRMVPISPAELPYLNVSVSILGPLRPIEASGQARAERIEIGKHGLRIRKGKHSGLLLPVVATERGWNAHQLLDAVCQKAGLPSGSWLANDAEVEIFDGIQFGAPMIGEVGPRPEASRVSEDDLIGLRSWVQDNIVAFQSGATPNYYAAGVADPTAAGVALRVTFDPDQPPVNWLQLSLREGLPLQSTLLNMTEQAARALLDRRWATGWRADIAIFSAAIDHGTGARYGIDEVRSETRAIAALDARRYALWFDPSAQPEQLVRRALSAQAFRSGATSLYSVRCDSTAESLEISSGPQPQTAVAARPPAVAGTFYPAPDADRERLTDSLLDGLPQTDKQRVAAAMVPHAGLRFSGRIAADVWRRIDLPETVLIIGPKHTPDGVDWAVAPHDVWQLSNRSTMAGNVELAQRIADSIHGMQLDAAAHAREHGIEVQLPLLYRIAPQTRVAAIAMSGGGIGDLEQAAKSLAGLLTSLEQPPLMIISSDMNHFADDAENRRRDRIALDILKQNDPGRLLEVCAAENISMCGRLPAALVLLTLRNLSIEPNYQEIGYDTSAAATGDKSRVVGYAGVLF